ncbi:MAG: bifunctional folylpolyglutamate synthase/dihydrofolate synthase [Candidatus ainarchaeum sp.]|nr:bifunctional folylpolyglutamate synthase/dihydrofolate synthase [Candidatus ainarchaeum sp.]
MKKMELSSLLSKFGSKPGLGRIKKILKRLGNPEKKLKVILVTGTNGKGSVTSYLSSILREAGYKIGSFYSPHILRYNERYKINGKEISDSKLKKYQDIILRLYQKEEYAMTEFEALTAIAYKYFYDEKCDYVVMEVGMGGRLDACNAAHEKIAIITNVELEHTQWLGKTIEKISYEKAGILKKGIGITGADGKALEVIEKIAKRRRRKLFSIGKNFFIKNINADEKGTGFDYFGNKMFKNIKLKMLGNYQAENCSLAIKASELLRINEKYIKKGVFNARITGRMEILNRKPLIVADVAHNPDGTKQLMKNIDIFKYKKLIIIFGVMKTKDWKKMLKSINGKAKEIIFPKLKYYNSENPNRLKKYLKKGKITKNCKEALKIAKKMAKKEDLILITGSIYFLGEFLESVKI